MRICDYCGFIYEDLFLFYNPLTEKYICRFCDVKKRIEQGLEVPEQELNLLWNTL